MIRIALCVLAGAFSFGALAHDCKPGAKKQPPPADDPPPPVASAATPVPPAAPIGDFADASIDMMDGKTPLEQARILQARGQLWMARLLIEKKALGPDGTKAEIEVLASICNQQDDSACVQECSARVGGKLKLDGGAARTGDPRRVHQEPDTDVARARDMVLTRRWDEARSILEPKVLGGRASKEEIRLLKQTCQNQGDRMCVALCDAKLK